MKNHIKQLKLLIRKLEERKGESIKFERYQERILLSLLHIEIDECEDK